MRVKIATWGRKTGIRLWYTEVMGAFRKSVFIGAGLIAASFAVFGVAAFFSAQWLAGVAGRTAADRTTAAERAYALGNLSALKQQAPQAAEYEKKIQTLLPIQDGLLGFPEFLEGAARTHNVDLGFSFGGTPVAPQGKDPGHVAFRASVQGDPANILDFIKDMEATNTRFMINFDSLNFTATANNYEGNLSGRVYFQ